MPVEPGSTASSSGGRSIQERKLARIHQIAEAGGVDLSTFLVPDSTDLAGAQKPNPAMTTRQKEKLGQVLDPLPPDKRRAVADLLGVPPGRINEALWGGTKQDIARLLGEVRAKTFNAISVKTTPSSYTPSASSREQDLARH